MAEIVSSVVTTVELIRACVNKYTEFCAFEEECATFRRSLSNVGDVLEDVKAELSTGNVSATNTSLRRPLELLQGAVAEGGTVLDRCSAARRKVLAFVFSRQLLGTLNKAKADVKEALRLLHFSSVKIQVATHRMMDSVSERLDTLQQQIHASYARHNEVTDLLLRAERQHHSGADDGNGIGDGNGNEDQQGASSLSDALVEMGVVRDAQDGADLLAELQREAESIRKAKVIYDEEILQAVLALTAPRGDASEGPVTTPETGPAQPSRGSKAASAVLDCMICPISLSGEVMHDPVTVVESGITYDRKSLCRSLLLYPDLEPATGQRFDQPLRYTPNLAVRNLITAQHGDSYYQRYDDDEFKAQYKAIWRDRLHPPPSVVVTTEDPTFGGADGKCNGGGGGDSIAGFSGVNAGSSLTETTSPTRGVGGSGRKSSDLPRGGFNGSASAGSCRSAEKSPSPYATPTQGDTSNSETNDDEKAVQPRSSTVLGESPQRCWSCRRRRMLFAGAAVVALVLIAGVVLSRRRLSPGDSQSFPSFSPSVSPPDTASRPTLRPSKSPINPPSQPPGSPPDTASRPSLRPSERPINPSSQPSGSPTEASSRPSLRPSERPNSNSLPSLMSLSQDMVPSGICVELMHCSASYNTTPIADCLDCVCFGNCTRDCPTVCGVCCSD